MDVSTEEEYSTAWSFGEVEEETESSGVLSNSPLEKNFSQETEAERQVREERMRYEDSLRGPSPDIPYSDW